MFNKVVLIAGGTGICPMFFFFSSKKKNLINNIRIPF